MQSWFREEETKKRIGASTCDLRSAFLPFHVFSGFKRKLEKDSFFFASPSLEFMLLVEGTRSETIKCAKVFVSNFICNFILFNQLLFVVEPRQERNRKSNRERGCFVGYVTLLTFLRVLIKKFIFEVPSKVL